MRYILQVLFALVITFSLAYTSCAQPLNQKKIYTKQDTLRGTITPERAWWDVMRYDILVEPDFDKRVIHGYNLIGFKVTGDKSGKMQIDLQQPMTIDSAYLVEQNNNKQTRTVVRYTNTGNVWYADLSSLKKNGLYQLEIFFHGVPRPAVTPPWDGGWIWSKDAKGRPWMTVACQGLGASVWYPCKDHQSDEPDMGASITVIVPDTLVAVANGKLEQEFRNPDDRTNIFKWSVKNPINNYNIVPYIGKYVNWKDTYEGEKGKLELDYWVLDYNFEKAQKQFGRDVKPMLKSFEDWFGPYPFYADGFKLVESSHLGMEHQSAIAYGNQYKNGYLGQDLSGSGWGTKWDFIIIHEAGHEWFANNITTKDIADMWVHEGFTAYSETLFTESLYGREAGNDYVTGTRQLIENDKPIIGDYGVNQEGSGDMYYKGANMLHTIRQVINDDKKFRKILRELNQEFYHKTVTTVEIEEFISKKADMDLSKIFDQYLRTTMIPVLEYKADGKKMAVRWTNCVDGFNMPVYMSGAEKWLKPTTKWTSVDWPADAKFEVDKNFYITLKNVR